MDPHPIKDPGVLIARIREDLHPQLLAAGFELAGRNKLEHHHGTSHWFDYTRTGKTLSVRWQRWTAGLVAELLDESGNVQIIAESRRENEREYPTYEEYMQRVDAFVASVKGWLLEEERERA